MRVCLLTRAPLSAEDDPLAELARRLADRDDVELTVALSEADASEDAYDVAIATNWQTTADLFGVRALRYAYRVDNLAHEALGAWQAEHIVAALSYDLPVDFLATTPAVAAALAQLRPEARCLLVQEGVGPSAERAPEPPEGAPLRVRALPGAEDIRDAMAEPHTAVARPLEADAVVGLERPADVLAAMQAGAVALVTGDAVVEHMRTGIVFEPDDARGAARWLDTLARDRALLAQLRAGALERAAAAPSHDQAAEALHAALRELLDGDPPADAQWPRRLMGDAMALAAIWRNEHHRLAGMLDAIQKDEAYLATKRVRAAVKDVPVLGRAARRLRRR